MQVKGKKNKTPWTKEEDKFLIENFPTKGPNYCYNNIENRGMGSIVRRAKLLGIEFLGRNWEPIDSFLKENYPTKGLHFCYENIKDCSDTAIRTRLNFLGLRSPSKKADPRWTKEEKELLKNCPISHCAGNEEIVEKFFPGRTYNGVMNQRYNMGLSIKRTPHSVDVSRFISLQDKESSFLCGLIWGDGIVTKVTNRIEVTMLVEDINAMLDIFNFFGEWKVRTFFPTNPNSKEVTSVRINDKQLHTFLSDLDFQEKSFVAPTKILDKIPHHLKHYFWNGYIMADGCFCRSKRNGAFFNITSTYEQDWLEMEILLNQLKISKYSIARRERTNNDGVVYNRGSDIKCSGHIDIKKIGEYIFKDPSFLGLERKYLKWKEIMERPKPNLVKKYPDLFNPDTKILIGY